MLRTKATSFVHIGIDVCCVPKRSQEHDGPLLHEEPLNVDGHPEIPRRLDGACSVQAPVSAGFGTELVEITIERIGGKIVGARRTNGPRVLISLRLGLPLDGPKAHSSTGTPAPRPPLDPAEEFMIDPRHARGQEDSLTRWSLAAALGLMTAAFLIDRVAPPKDHPVPLPSKEVRDASPAGLAAESGDHGRQAKSPAEIPAKGWKDILLRVYGNIGDHRILALAAGMTYYSILAIFPALAALVAIYGFFSDPGSIAKHLDDVSGFIPGGAVEVAREQLTRVATKGDRTLGFTFAVGLAISLWSANAAMKSLFDTLNIVYGEQEKRGFVRLNAMSLGFTVGAIAFVVAALGAVVVIPVVVQFVGLSNAADLLVRIGRWPALFVALAFALACIYRFGPSRQAPRWTWITWGSSAAALLWLAASGLFSFYAANFGTFNATYGSLGAVIGFMTWLWISAIVTLLGAELNAEMEHQTARDTTTGQPKPLGDRGAKMADTVGAPRS